jgi:hypothetical protein
MPLLLFALLLLPLDVAARRLVLGRDDWRALLATLPWRRGAPADATAAPAFAPLAGLRQRRALRRGSATAGAASLASPEPAISAAHASAAPPNAIQGMRERLATSRPQQPIPTALPERAPAVEATPTAPIAPPAESGPSSTSRLLDAKRRRREAP